MQYKKQPQKRIRRKKGDKNYINNKEFTESVIECKKNDELSDFTIKCFITLANRAVEKLYFRDYRDKEDCIQSALVDCIKYWRNFDPTKSTPPNAFAYFTQMCKNGYAKEWKKIHRKTGLQDGENVETISLNMKGDSSVYTI
jgi:DNA-directed RNA polymerase specialized sigma24 family protein